ncbi:MAG TPA: RNA polymerase sigma-70 factor [Chitinophagaceae bacterium]|jgi:RNA polymerase sigma-70 factor (ECF subfamily)|nr:RNA polymerase sigma-70 factor [Chitinophagaceae bacterium]
MLPVTPAYNLLSDEELFSLTQREDLKAFEALYCRYWPELTDAAYRRLQSRQKAEDLVQELFISLYHKREELQFTVSLRAYLNQALKFKVLNEYRSEQVRTAYAKTVFFRGQGKNVFALDVETKELQQQLEGVLSGLPDKCRQVFRMSRLEQMTHKEIALELRISVSTVEKHIGKALRTLRERLKAYHYAG